MKVKLKKAALYLLLLAVGIAAMIIMFKTNKPDGVIGFLIFMSCIYLVIGIVIKLCKLTSDPTGTFAALLDLLFWLP